MSKKLNIIFSIYSTPYSTWEYYVNALKKYHNVVTLGYSIGRDEIESYKYDACQNFAFYNDFLINRFYEFILSLSKPCDIQTNIKIVDLSYFIEKFPFEADLFIWSDSSDIVLPSNLQLLKCPKLALIGDSHLNLQWRLEYAKNFDYVFVLFSEHVDIFKKAGCKNVYYLPVACEPSLYLQSQISKAHDITFIGSTNKIIHSERVELLNKIFENNINLNIDYKISHEMALAYSRSKIIFNKSVKNDINMRVFEALCSGSSLLTNKLPKECKLDELFQDRKHLVLYENNNLIDLIKYYLNNEDERILIAQEGKREVLSKHTYEHRIKELLSKIYE